MQVSTPPLPDNDDVYLKTDELLKVLGLKSDRTLRYWDANGTGPKRTRVNRGIRYRVGDVRTWLEGADNTGAA